MSNQYIEYLHSKYYSHTDMVSTVTSSHWQNIGESDLMLKNGNINIKGLGGFGDFVPNTLRNKIRHIFYHFLIRNYLRKYSSNKNLENLSRKLARNSHRLYLMDCAKHVMGIESALDGLKAKNFTEKKIKTICIIGDGYGFMGNLIKEFDPNVKIIFVNLGKQLIFDLQVTLQVNANCKCKLINQSNDFSGQYDMYFLEAENFSLLEGLNIDMFFNVASMQEMNKAIVDKYFEYMRTSIAKNIYFYCCNRVLKSLPDGEEIIFDNYHWNDCTVFKEREPKWYQYYPSQTPPFWKPFDGRFKEKVIKF
jgi:hypothetical protein